MEERVPATRSPISEMLPTPGTPAGASHCAFLREAVFRRSQLLRGYTFGLVKRVKKINRIRARRARRKRFKRSVNIGANTEEIQCLKSWHWELTQKASWKNQKGTLPPFYFYLKCFSPEEAEIPILVWKKKITEDWVNPKTPEHFSSWNYGSLLRSWKCLCSTLTSHDISFHLQFDLISRVAIPLIATHAEIKG